MPYEKLIRYGIILGVLAAALAGLYFGARSIYQAGHVAGANLEKDRYNQALLELRDKQAAEAKTLNTKLDNLLTLSQDGATALELYTDQNEKYLSGVIAQVKTKPLATKDCKLTPEFQQAWDAIRKGAPK